MRKKPFSGAQKKKQLQEKRARQRGEEPDESIHFELFAHCTKFLEHQHQVHNGAPKGRKSQPKPAEMSSKDHPERNRYQCVLVGVIVSSSY
jgi:hypothetical protein